MNKICGIVVMAGFALSGCATKTPEKSSVTPPPAVARQAPAEAVPATPAKPPVQYAPANASSAASIPVSPVAAQSEPAAKPNELRAEQCLKELEVLKLYNKVSYDKYQAEYRVISQKTSQYMQAKDLISADINDMVLPGYQFKIREFCFRVKTRVSELIIRQAR